mgnify:CR=1 FL=1
MPIDGSKDGAAGRRIRLGMVGGGQGGIGGSFAIDAADPLFLLAGQFAGGDGLERGRILLDRGGAAVRRVAGQLECLRGNRVLPLRFRHGDRALVGGIGKAFLGSGLPVG